MKLPRHAELWLPALLQDRRQRLRENSSPPRRLWVALTDHFEPMGGAGDTALGLERLRLWQDRWPELAAQAPHDSRGRPPCFTFFYPQEEYSREVLNVIAALTRNGIGDVEVHIHHRDDTRESLSEKLTTFCRRIHENHGLLRMHGGRLAFGFIHGNWALDNSWPDGRDCGVTGELQLLRDLGCYADFTMPSAPCGTQSRRVNRIYWTTGDPTRPRGYDQGVDATVGGGRQGDLLMIPGPLGLRFRERLAPRLETGELAVYDPPSAYRASRWLDLAPRLGDDLFLKLYGHSARPDNAAALLGTPTSPGSLSTLFRDVHQLAAERNLELHWVSAWDMFRRVDNLMTPRRASPRNEVKPRAAIG